MEIRFGGCGEDKDLRELAEKLKMEGRGGEEE